MRWAARWWTQPDRFDGWVVYLGERKLQHPARYVVAAVTAAFTLVGAVMLIDTAPATVPAWHRPAQTAALTTSAAMAALWMWRFPSRTWSRRFVHAAGVVIAAVCITQPDPGAGLTGCYAFVVLAGYLGVFHGGARLALGTAALSALAGAVLIRRVATGHGDLTLAACELAMLGVFVLGTPAAADTVLTVMAADTARAERDALTGLLNRRGFHRHTARLLDRYTPNTRAANLTVAMIDLDDFKRVNDHHGHAAGDQALIDIGRALTDATSPTAVLARIGGEEFLIADITPDGGTDPDAITRLCPAVSRTPHHLTASIGLTSIAVTDIDADNRRGLITRLISRADAAMYVAKSAGGDRCHRGPPL